MTNDKYKTFKFAIIMCIICAVLTGINYILFNVKAMGISFIIATVVSIFNIFAYKAEKKNDRNKK